MSAIPKKEVLEEELEQEALILHPPGSKERTITMPATAMTGNFNRICRGVWGYGLNLVRALAFLREHEHEHRIPDSFNLHHQPTSSQVLPRIRRRGAEQGGSV